MMPRGIGCAAPVTTVCPVFGSLFRGGLSGTVAITSFILLSGCVTTQPIPQKVFVEVPVKCIKEAPVLPVTMLDSELAKQDDFALVITLATERIALRQYSKEAAAVITSCTR